YAHRDNFMDLDPTYKDALGRPLVRMTYNGTDNDHAVALPRRQARRDHPRDEPDPLRGALSTEELYRRAVSIDPQYRRHHDWLRPEDERGEPLSAGLGRAQPVRPGRLGVSATARLQSDRHGGGARLLVGQSHHREISKEPRHARACLSRVDECSSPLWPPPVR